ncbi:MAG: YaeQ family protein [Nitrospirae bacterium]|nr:YaeQ family protein [Nitrospirota bacterium]
MALKSTIFKAELQISDMDRNSYGDHSLTIARHPSETDERMMVRLLAFALHADEALVFADSIGNDDEPSLWQKDLTGAIQVWIDVGQPDEKRIRKACGRASRVFIFAYGGHGVDVWLNQIKNSLERLRNLAVINLPAGAPAALARLAKRSMKLQFTIQDGQVWVTDDQETVHLDLTNATVLSPT